MLLGQQLQQKYDSSTAMIICSKLLHLFSLKPDNEAACEEYKSYVSSPSLASLLMHHWKWIYINVKSVALFP